MPTALGIYVTVDDLKARLSLPTSDTSSDAVLAQICDETNQWIESYTGRVLAPVDSAVYTFDAHHRTRLDLERLGVRAVTLLEVASATGAAFSTVAAGEYFIRPTPVHGMPGTSIVLNTGTWFYSGYDTIRVTMTAGYEQIPDDVRSVAIAIATRSWRARQSGQSDVVGDATTGEALVTAVVAPEFKRTLDRYKPALVA